VFSRHHRKIRLIFALADAALALAAFEAAYQLRSGLPFFSRIFFLEPAARLLLESAAVAFWVAAALWIRAYDRLENAGPVQIAAASLGQSVAATGGVILVQYLARLDLSRSFLALLGLTAWGLLSLFRLAAPRLIPALRREFGTTHHVVIVGPAERAARMQLLWADRSGEGLQIDRVMDISEATRELPALLTGRVVDEVVFAADSIHLASLEDLFLLCDELGVRTRVAIDFFPHIHSRVFLDRLGEAPMLTFAAAPQDEIRLLMKRALDTAVAAAALVLLSPLMLLIAGLIRLTSPGPALFRQRRCGLNGREFDFYKFRSMVANAEELKASLEHLNERDAVAFKIRNDPRLTPLGRWLRKFSIDEWPQFWNVLKGDMSLVGPRPAVPGEVLRYQRWQRRRLRMRPGLTCLWALQGRDSLDFDTWMRLDMEYIDRWSLALDLQILARTVPQVLLGRGAH
jgi:exopolysaccharide biosynthesis polyprenyl glycosylphosphotransferase